MKTLEVALEEKKTEFYKDLTALSKFNEKKVDSKDQNNIDSFKLANDLGFVNSSVITKRNEIISKNKNFNDAVRQATLSLAFIKEMANYFGEGTILVKRDDFVYLIQKYGLVCGTFSDYLGIVPDKNLLEISEAKEKIESLLGLNSHYCTGNKKVLCDAYKSKATRIITDIQYYREKKLKKEVASYLNYFPIVLAETGYSDFGTSSNIKDYLSDYIPRDEISKISEIKFSTIFNSGMFICAPRKDMKNAGREISFRPAPKDPFICSLVPYGVVIYSRWGKEAQDATLTKYDELFARMRGA